MPNRIDEEIRKHEQREVNFQKQWEATEGNLEARLRYATGIEGQTNKAFARIQDMMNQQNNEIRKKEQADHVNNHTWSSWNIALVALSVGSILANGATALTSFKNAASVSAEALKNQLAISQSISAVFESTKGIVKPAQDSTLTQHNHNLSNLDQINQQTEAAKNRSNSKTDEIIREISKDESQRNRAITDILK